MPGRVLHLDPDAIAEFQERRRRLHRAGWSRPCGFRRCRNSRAPPSGIGLPGPPSASRLETVPEPMMVPAASGRVLAAWAISVGKSKVMSTPAHRPAEGLAVDEDQQRQMRACRRPRPCPARPASPRRARRPRRLGLEEAEALGEFGRDQVAQADIVDQHDQPDRRRRLFAGRAHRHVADDDGDFGLHVDAPGFVRQARSDRAAPMKLSEPP